MNAGEVIFKFKGDDKDLDGKVKGLASSIGSGIATAAKTAGIAIAGISTALGGAVMKSVQMAGDLEQQLGGAEAVYGEFADNIKNLAAGAFDKAGMSMNDYLATANKMGALMQGSGVATQKSVDLTTQAMQRAADVASIMGIDINSAMESIAGAAKGNFTMMDNLGVAMNAGTIEAYALSQGIKKSYNEMTKAEQVTLAYQMFLEKTAYATGNYAKENETFAGSLQTLKASFDNFMSGAAGVDPLIDSVLGFADILVNSIGEMAPKIVDGIVGLVNGVVPKIPKILQKLLPSLIKGSTSLIQGLVSAFPSIVQNLTQIIPMILQIVPQLLQGLTSQLPIILQSLIDLTLQVVTGLAQMLPTMIPMIIEGILSIIPVLLQNLPLFIEAGIQLLLGLATGLVDSIPVLVGMLPEIIEALIQGILGAIPLLISEGPRLTLALATGLIMGIPQLAKSIPEIIGAIIIGLGKGIVDMTRIGGDLIKGLWNGMLNLKDWIVNKVKDLGNSILDGIKGIFGINSPSKVMYGIGVNVDEGFINGIDSMQDEIDSTFDGAFDLSPQLFGTASQHFSPNVYTYVNIESKTDPLGQSVHEIKDYSNGSKNSYNYGGAE